MNIQTLKIGSCVISTDILADIDNITATLASLSSDISADYAAKLNTKLDKTEGVLEPGSFGLADGSGVEGFFVRKDGGIYIGTPTGSIEIPKGTRGGTMAITSDIPDVIDLATATTTGKAADALAVATALEGKATSEYSIVRIGRRKGESLDAFDEVPYDANEKAWKISLDEYGVLFKVSHLEGKTYRIIAILDKSTSTYDFTIRDKEGYFLLPGTLDLVVYEVRNAALCAKSLTSQAVAELDIPTVTTTISTTETGKAAEAAAVATALNGKLDKSDVVAPATDMALSGKAADAKAVGEALMGKVDVVAIKEKFLPITDVNGTYDLSSYTIRKHDEHYSLYDASGNAIGSWRMDGTWVAGDAGIRFNGITPPGDIPMLTFGATISDIAAATKLTPVFSEWTLGDHTPNILIRNISATYDETKKGWETTEEMSTNGGQTWNEYTVLADKNPDPDKTATSITCISATYVRTIIGYTTANGENLMSGADDAKTALFADTALTEKITELVEAATKDKRDKTDLSYERHEVLDEFDISRLNELAPPGPGKEYSVVLDKVGSVWCYSIYRGDPSLLDLVATSVEEWDTESAAKAAYSFTIADHDLDVYVWRGEVVHRKRIDISGTIALTSDIPTKDYITALAETVCKNKFSITDSDFKTAVETIVNEILGKT